MTETLSLLPVPRKSSLRFDLRSPGRVDAEVQVRPGTVPPQGYRITLNDRGVSIVAGDEAGEFYARQTLVQLRRQFGEDVPCGEIEDWPDFPVRGVMLDISRDKVPTMATLFGLVDMLAELKINQLQLYTEHTFAYPSHREVWEHASPLTGDEVRTLDVYCRARFIEL